MPKTTKEMLLYFESHCPNLNGKIFAQLKHYSEDYVNTLWWPQDEHNAEMDMLRTLMSEQHFKKLEKIKKELYEEIVEGIMYNDYEDLHLTNIFDKVFADNGLEDKKGGA